MGPTLYRTHIPFVPSQLTLLFLIYGNMKIWPWKSKSKVMCKVKGQDHIVGPTTYWLTSLSFHVNWPSLRYSFFKILPCKFKVKVMREVKVESHKLCLTSCSHPFCSVSIIPPVHVTWLFQHLTLQIQGQGHKPMIAQLHVKKIPRNFKWCKSIQRFQRYVFHKDWTPVVLDLTSFGPIGNPIWSKWAN